jgi:hypothetical protein
MAIKVQGTTVIDDSRNITANVICGNFCGGSINVAITPRTCNVGFVTTAGVVVCADQFETARIRSAGGLIVCVCNMPKGKPIYFDIAATDAGTYCFKDASNTSMTATCVGLPGSTNTLVAVVQNPAFCGVCCYIQEYSCAYRTYSLPDIGSNCFSRIASFGVSDTGGGITSFTCNTSGSFFCDGWCQMNDVACSFAKGCDSASTLCVSFRRNFCCHFNDSMRNGLINFGDGRSLWYIASGQQGQWFLTTSSGEHRGGAALFCNCCSAPYYVACGWCWACSGSWCGFPCGCSPNPALCCCRGPMIGADIGTNKYVYILGSVGSCAVLNVYPLTCIASGFATGVAQQILLPGAGTSQVNCSTHYIYNMKENTTSNWVTLLTHPCLTNGNFCLGILRACKTNNSVCPLCFVTCCSTSWSGFNACNVSNCFVAPQLEVAWICAERLVMTFASGGCEWGMAYICDQYPKSLTPGWYWNCICRRCGTCMGSSAGAPIVSPSGRQVVAFTFFSNFNGCDGSMVYNDCCGIYNGTTCLLCGECGNQQINQDFEFASECCIIGCYTTCQNCGCGYGLCLYTANCAWQSIWRCGKDENFRYYPCICTCIPGCAGTACFTCAGAAGTCSCRALPSYRYFQSLSGSSFTALNFTQATNHCCTCKA